MNLDQLTLEQLQGNQRELERIQCHVQKKKKF